MFKIYSRIYYDRIEKEYIRIICLDKKPEGELSNYISILKPQNLHDNSYFASNNRIGNEANCCIYAIKRDISNKNCNNNYKYITIGQIEEVFDFLVNNNYEIVDSFTKYTKKNKRLNNNDDFICYVKKIE